MNPESEVKVYGVKACLAVFTKGRDSIVTCWTHAPGTKPIKDIVVGLADREGVVVKVPEKELAEIAGSDLHEGVCLLVKRSVPGRLSQWLRDSGQVKTSVVLALAGKSKSSSVGHILRLSATLGAKALCVEDALDAQQGEAARWAEGAAESLTVLQESDLEGMATAARKAGYAVATVSSVVGESLYLSTIPPRTLFIMGANGGELPQSQLYTGDMVVRIPGTAAGCGLDPVAMAAVLLGESFRRFSTGDKEGVYLPGRAGRRGAAEGYRDRAPSRDSYTSRDPRPSRSEASDRPRREGPPRFQERSEHPRFGDRDERPRREAAPRFDDRDAPPRREDQPRSDDRNGPPRSGGSDRPRFGDRNGPPRSGGSDRPRFGDRSGPPRSGGSDRPRFGDRSGPPRSGGSDRPRFGDRSGPPRSGGSDRPRFDDRNAPPRNEEGGLPAERRIAKPRRVVLPRKKETPKNED